MPYVSLAELVERVTSGESLASFPTDTVPALAAHPDHSDRIYAAKERPPDKPLILMGATWADLLPYIDGTAAEMAIWQQVAQTYWPGALTLVLPGSDRVPPGMNPTQTGTLGIRVPNHPLARYVLARTGPLATTSVNRSGQPPLEDMAAIATQFPEVLQLSSIALGTIRADIGGFTLNASGIPSTVIRWTGMEWETLRQGGVDFVGR